jgi:hypothetical protein
MFETDLTINQFLLGYCRMMVEEIPDERMAEQPLPNVNHPAWILGHLAYSGDAAVGRLGGQKTLADGWTQKYGPGSRLLAVRAEYPPKKELLLILEERFEHARRLAAVATKEHMAHPNPNPRMKAGLPTVGDSVAFLLTGHLAVHLGQLSAWRRMVGMPPLF